MPLRKLIFLFLLLPFFGVAQTVIPTGAVNQLTYQRGGYGADSVLAIPVKDTVYNGFPSYRLRGRLTLRPQDSVIYYHTGSYWKAVGTGSGGGGTYTAGFGLDLSGNRFDVDTATIAQVYLLDYKVDVSDTANWINSIRVNPTMIKQGTAKDPILGVDTAVIATQYDNSLKLNISDTSAMLTPYINFGDTNAVIATKSDIPVITTPTLQQVTAAGNTTADTIIAEDYRFNGMTYSQRRAAELFDNDDTVKIATGILRPVLSGSTVSWRIVKWDDPDFTTYAAVRLDSVAYSSSMYIFVYFGDTASRIISCDVTIDDDFAIGGITAGASIGLDYIRVNFTWDKGNHGGIMYRDGTGWHYSFALEATSVTEIGTNGIEWAETQTLQQGGYLTPSADYLGFLSGGYEVKYLGSKGYTLKHATGLPPTKRHYLIDAYGNDVPLTSLDATDIFQVTSNRSIRHFNPGNSNNWNGITGSSALFVTLRYK